jgi:arylsulfatase A-like enzyme
MAIALFDAWEAAQIPAFSTRIFTSEAILPANIGPRNATLQWPLMPAPRTGALILLLLTAAACTREPVRTPFRLLVQPAMDGGPPRSGSLSPAGDARPALLESASWRVRLPAASLLTFGMGFSWAGEGEAPGWYRLTVRANDRVLAERNLNPRAARGWRDVSLPLEGLRGQTTLAFELRFTDRDGRDIAQPPGMLLGVSDPTVHAVADYGQAKGIVLVSIDTLRRDHVGAYGYPRPTTPRLDALAREGLLADDAVSTSSWTLPAHLSLLTSLDPGAHGGVDMEHGFNGHVPTLAETLHAAGYATQAVTSHLYVSSVYGLDRGFDHLDFHQDRKATDVADRALDLLDRLGDRPFFLFLHFYDPHWHYDPPASTRATFERPYAGNVTGLWQDFSRRDRITEADVQHLLDLYDGEIRYVDDELGRVLDHLKARGLDRSTLLAVVSDHGEEFREHGSWEHQKTLYEEVVRIPLLMRGPEVPARREPGQVSLLDVAPTVLAWAGLPPWGHAQGRSLLTPAAGPREAYGETDHTTDGTHKLFLRGAQGRWKTIVSLSRADRSIRETEWYDLSSDPGEKRNVSPPPELAEALRRRAVGRWQAARARSAPGPAVSLTSGQRDRLRALGYVGP